MLGAEDGQRLLLCVRRMRSKEPPTSASVMSKPFAMKTHSSDQYAFNIERSRLIVIYSNTHGLLKYLIC